MPLNPKKIPGRSTKCPFISGILLDIKAGTLISYCLLYAIIKITFKNTMHRYIHLFICFLLTVSGILPIEAAAQSFSGSNLPIVIIQTDTDPLTGLPRVIPDEPKVPGSMKVIFRPDGSRNMLADQNNPAYLQYNGRIGVEIRGSTSQVLPKKSYGLTTLKEDNASNNNVAILGMPRENDWVLNALAFDPSLVRDFISHELSRDLGNYASRLRYCEVIVNGDYKGLYLFMEKLKIDQERVNILKMSPTDNTLPNVSGGYITKADKTTGGDPVAWITPSYSSVPVTYIHDSPDPEDITPQQHAYIQNQFQTLTNVLATKDESIFSGYPSLIDVPSFVDFILVNELSANVDAYQFSTFFHKDRNGKLRAGPIWDFNLTFGNDLIFWGYDRSHTNTWQFANGDNTGSTFWRDLFQRPAFKCYLARRWNQSSAEGQPLNYNVIARKIDEAAALIAEAVQREDQRWGSIGNHANHIQKIKQWLQARIVWLNTNLRDFQACANPVLPRAVISKIHYHPLAPAGYISDDLEFIEISNPGNTSIDLSGFYFRELGLTYRFPNNAKLLPQGKLILASNANAFLKFYGIAPFDQYTRNLSNKAQKLVLADAFGNTIDEVTYSDAAPWPVEADGKGPFLQLPDLNADNSLAANWVLSSQFTTNISSPNSPNLLRIYPNPATSEITITSEDKAILTFSLSDLPGRALLHQNAGRSREVRVDLSGLPANLYLLEITLEDGSKVMQKVIKE
jgi:hypothetical protein